MLEGGAGADEIFGGAGADTASYAGSAAAVTVNLGTGTASGGDARGDTLSGVEHLEGSAHEDVLIGDDGANRLLGAGGNDGLIGGAGADRLEGGSGVDLVSYAGSAAAVMVNLATNTVSGGDAEGDVLVDVENVEGSAHGDTLTGDDGANMLFGTDGNDTLTGGAGADWLEGGLDADLVSYAGSAAAVMVNLATDVVSGGDAEGDVLVDVENVEGSAHGDRLTGDSGRNELFGAGGNDTLTGGAGADVLNGGSGEDTASYAGSAAVVTVNLATDTASGGDAQGDELDEIEHLEGSAHGDTLTGGSGVNRLFGAGGNDTLAGGAGADRLEGGAGVDTVSYADSAAAVTVNLATGTGAGGDAEGDVVVDVESVEGSAYRDTLTGDSGANRLFGAGGNDRLVGGAGADRLEGDSGEDTVSYAGSAAAVTVDLSAGTASGGDAEGDVLVEVEHLEGSAHGDTLAGDNSANRLSGLGGNDRLVGFGGNDVLAGGAGADVLNGGADVDTVSYAGSAAVTVNLATGAVSGGDAEGDTFSGIENVEGSAHGDTLTGDSGANRLLGAGGNDILTGGPGADRLEGGPGTDTVSYAGSAAAVRVDILTDTVEGGDAEGDTLSGIENVEGSAHEDTLLGDHGANRLSGLGGDDRLIGYDGNDVLEGGAGADHLEGGRHRDTVSYAGSSAAVTVNLATGTASGGDAQGDRLFEFENVRGSAHGDTLTGDGGGNRLFGEDGNDTLKGGAGADRLEGGAGEDTVSYAGSSAAVMVDLGAGTVSGGDAGGDVLVDIENVEGSAHGDVLTGDGGANRLLGAGGNDTLTGSAGADRLEGGAGEDTVSYAGSSAAVMVDLGAGTVSGGDAEGDTISGVENVEGSAHGDVLAGDGGANRLFGAGGDDTLEGGAGADRLEGGADEDTASYAGSAAAVTVNLGTDTVSGGDAGGDVLVDIENVEGSAHGDVLTGDGGVNRLFGAGGDDTLTGGAGADWLEGGAGADRLEGGADEDTASYAGSAAAVTVNLGTDTVSGGDAEGDVLVDIENVEGSAHGDVLTGDGDANRLLGAGGDDTLTGGAGADRLEGGAGADRLEGGADEDTASYAGSAAAVAVNLGTDTVSGGDAEGDVLVDIENVEGSAHGDELTGDGGANRLLGAGGDDTLTGGAGADRLEGGAGEDTASYAGAARGVTVNLATGRGSAGDARDDVLVEIENLEGSARGDQLTGDDGANRLFGAWGNDTLTGGAGADRLDGGPGADTASYLDSDEAVTVNLGTGQGRHGDAEGDTYVFIEIVFGSDYGDRLTGDFGDNLLLGWNGNDTLVGGAGADQLRGSEGVDTLSYAGSDAAVTVSLQSGSASGGHARGDTFTSIENLEGSAHGDTLTGDNGDNSLSGGAGSDTFIFLADNGTDNITDFTNGEDLIDLSAFSLSGFEALTTSSSPDGVTVDLTAHGGGTVLLEGFDIGDLDATDFIF